MRNSKQKGRTKDLRKGPRNIREKKFIKNVALTQEIGRSAVLAGYSDPSYGTQLLKNPRIREAVIAAMEKAGVTESLLFSKLKEGLEAVYPKKYGARGQLVQDNEPDFFTRAIYLDKGLKVYGAYAPEKQEVTEKRIIVMITPEFVKGLVDTGAVKQEEVKELLDSAPKALLPE